MVLSSSDLLRSKLCGEDKRLATQPQLHRSYSCNTAPAVQVLLLELTD